ncbi:MAG: AraC family transcriptional regulator [Solobacterium sp.]|nr:AraC family transcriptional regulator [Solobacterium sp.]
MCCLVFCCGIPDSNYFSRTFRKEYGMSATQYRMSERKKQQVTAR